MEQSWNNDPAKRPSAEKVSDRICGWWNDNDFRLRIFFQTMKHNHELNSQQSTRIRFTPAGLFHHFTRWIHTQSQGILT
jgi:hypothetical protein